MIHCITRRHVYVLFCIYHKATYIPLKYRSVKDVRQCITPRRRQNVYLTWIIIKDCVHAMYWHLLLIFMVVRIDILKLKYQKDNGFTYWPNYKSVISRFCENKCESFVFIDESRCFPKIDEIQSADLAVLLNIFTQMNKHVTQQFSRSFGQIRLLTGSRFYLNYSLFLNVRGSLAS